MRGGMLSFIFILFYFIFSLDQGVLNVGNWINFSFFSGAAVSLRLDVGFEDCVYTGT